jgi:formylglycine-generating enzyme
MFGKSYAITPFAFLLFLFIAAFSAHGDVFNMVPTSLTSLKFVEVGDSGNAADTAVMTIDGTTGYGSVGYKYNMGQYDVTAAQYCAFLNAVATTGDGYNLYSDNMAGTLGCQILRGGTSGSYTYSVDAVWANRPVNYVSWGDAVRFCNWLQNGQPTGAEGVATTEKGAYELNGAVTDAALLAVSRTSNATYFLPTENEWYKAAYYDPNKPGGAGYWTYPTKSDTPPSNVNSETGTNNANFNNYNNGTNNYTLGPPYFRTNVGAFAASPSAYATFDQGGNVFQWLESKVTIGSNTYRTLRGGSYGYTATSMASTAHNGTVPSGDGPGFGFRVAGVVQSIFCVWKGGTDDTMTAWGIAANWLPGTNVPGGPGTNVLFGTQPASCPIVDMISVGRTVGNIIFDSSTSTLIQSTYGHSLTLDNRGGVSTIDVTGNHFISAPVVLNNDAILSGTGTLTLWGGITGNHTLTVIGTVYASSINVGTLVVGVKKACVPEPSCLGLLLAGAITFVAFARRRR